MKKFTKPEKQLIFWTIFIGAGALLGTTMMWIDTTGAMFGMKPMLQYFQVLPFADTLFQDFAFSGLALLLINGLWQFFTMFLLIRHNRFAALASILCGIFLMMWTCLQFSIFPFPPNPLSIAYFVFGVIEFYLGVRLLSIKQLPIQNSQNSRGSQDLPNSQNKQK